MDKISLLKQKRLARGLSVRQVAESTGIPKSTMDRIERGEQKASIEHGRILYQFYDYELSLGQIHDPMFDFEVAGAA